MTVQYLHSILARDLDKWLACGWTEHARDRKPSVAEDIVVLVWDHGEPCKMPDGGGQ